jgi:hypothetical protein
LRAFCWFGERPRPNQIHALRSPNRLLY